MRPPSSTTGYTKAAMSACHKSAFSCAAGKGEIDEAKWRCLCKGLSRPRILQMMD